MRAELDIGARPPDTPTSALASHPAASRAWAGTVCSRVLSSSSSDLGGHAIRHVASGAPGRLLPASIFQRASGVRARLRARRTGRLPLRRAAKGVRPSSEVLPSLSCAQTEVPVQQARPDTETQSQPQGRDCSWVRWKRSEGGGSRCRGRAEHAAVGSERRTCPARRLLSLLCRSSLNSPGASAAGIVSRMVLSSKHEEGPP